MNKPRRFRAAPAAPDALPIAAAETPVVEPMPARHLGLVRGVVERVTISTPLDPYLSLDALAAYSSLSERTIRAALHDAHHRLPHFKVGTRVLVRRSEFDQWLAAYREQGTTTTTETNVSRIVDDVLRDLRPTTTTKATPR